MGKHGEFVLFPEEFGGFTIVIEFKEQVFDLSPDGINQYGKCIKTVNTIEKAARIIKEYEKRMGRLNATNPIR